MTHLNSSFLHNLSLQAPGQINRRFILGGSDYSAWVTRWPTVRRTFDNIAPVTVTIALANQEGTFNFFRSDKTKMIADAYLYIEAVGSYHIYSNMIAMSSSISPAVGLASTQPNSFWGTFNGSFMVFSGGQLDPFGGSTAVVVGVGSHDSAGERAIFIKSGTTGLNTQSLDTFSGYQYNVSAYFKQNHASVKYAYVTAGFSGAWDGEDHIQRIFDIESGTIAGTHVTNYTSASSASIEAVSGYAGWYRCAVAVKTPTFSLNGANNYTTVLNTMFGLSTNSGGGSVGFTSVGSHSLLVAGPQVTLSDTPTHYTPTSGSQVAHPELVAPLTKGMILYDVGAITSASLTKYNPAMNGFEVQANGFALSGSGGGFSDSITATSATNYGELCGMFNLLAAGQSMMLRVDSGNLWLQSCLSGIRSFVYDADPTLFLALNSGSVNRQYFAGGASGVTPTIPTSFGTVGSYEVFVGKVSRVKYDDGSVSISMTDKLKKLSERVMGSTDAPVSYLGSNYLPSDLAWWAITSYGNLSGVASTSNPDIDYSSFLEWAGIFSGDNIHVQARFEGTKVVTALRKLQRMTDSAIFLKNDKLSFRRFTIANSEFYALDNSNVSGVDLEIDETQVINRQYVFANYDVSSDIFATTVFIQDSASVNSFGLREEIEKDQSIWYTTSANAQNLAERVIFLRGKPFEKTGVDAFLGGLLYEIGDMISLTDGITGLSSSPFRILEKGFNMDTCLTNYEATTNQSFNAFILDQSLLDGAAVLT